MSPRLSCFLAGACAVNSAWLFARHRPVIGMVGVLITGWYLQRLKAANARRAA